MAADGFEPVVHGSPDACNPGDCVVALVIAPPSSHFPDGDYHFYRRNGDGGWSHKPGGYSARAVANPEGAPATCNLADGTTFPYYTEFCGYYCYPCELQLPPALQTVESSTPGVHATLQFFSGQPDPSWEIMDPSQVDVIRTKILAGVPTTPAPPRTNFGYTGLHVTGVGGRSGHARPRPRARWRGHGR
jgi:hypothetical protein